MVLNHERRVRFSHRAYCSNIGDTLGNSKKKKKMLGEPFGTANGKLRKSILFDLVVSTNQNVCYQCGEVIDSIDDFSVEHKTPWQNSGSPIQLFYDLDNIAFSHLKCNCLASNRKTLHLNSELGETGERYIRIVKNRNLKKKYQIRIPKDNKTINLGYAETIEKAVIIRDEYLNKEVL